MIVIETRIPTEDEYLILLRSVDWRLYLDENIRLCLAETKLGVVGYDDD